jgi:hypothetical protein
LKESSHVLEALTQEKRAIETDLARYQADVTELRKSLATLERMIEMERKRAVVAPNSSIPVSSTALSAKIDLAKPARSSAASASDAGHRSGNLKRPPRNIEGNRTQQVLKFADQFVEELGRPFTIHELLSGLKASGYELDVKTDHVKFAQKTLWGCDRYRFVKEARGWWLVGHPLPTY